MNELKNIVYESIKTLSEKRDQDIRPHPDPPFKLAFFFGDILKEVHRKYSEQLYSKKDIKKQLLALEKEGLIKMILTCTPMFLLRKNHEKYFVDKSNVIVKFATKQAMQEICRLFPESRLIEDKNQLLTPMTFYDFHSFGYKHKKLSESIELIKE